MYSYWLAPKVSHRYITNLLLSSLSLVFPDVAHNVQTTNDEAVDYTEDGADGDDVGTVSDCCPLEQKYTMGCVGDTGIKHAVSSKISLKINMGNQQTKPKMLSNLTTAHTACIELHEFEISLLEMPYQTFHSEIHISNKFEAR